MTTDLAALGWAVSGVVLTASGVALCVRSGVYASGVLLASSGVLLVVVGAVPGDAATVLAVAAMAGLSSAAATYPHPRWDLPRMLTLAAIVAGTPLLTWQLARVRGLDQGDVGWIAFALVSVGASHLWWQLETTDAHTRSSLLWLSSTTGATVFLIGVVALAGAPAGLAAVVNACLGLVGVAAVLGAEREHPLDGRWLASRAAAWFFSLACAFAVATLLFTLVAWRSGSPPGIVALALAAVVCGTLWNPLMVLVQRVSDGVLFGFRPDALTAAQRVVVGIGDDPAAAIRAIQEGLVLPYAALTLDGESQIEVGDPSHHRRVFPIDSHGEHIGELVVGIRPGDLGLSRDDERVLTLSLPLLVQTIEARSLATNLQRARAASAAAREEERRRLRGDLHDGLGPRLTGIAFTADAARLAATHEAAAPMLDRIRHEAETALDEIRELVYGLRPPALDELGLAGAIRLRTNALHGLPTTVEASAFPALPAVVEVAAYRIVMEALTNIVRHSGATRASVTLVARQGRLAVTVADNGHAASEWTPGIGLTSMRERAEELGGSVTYAATPTGSMVRALLPLRSSSAADSPA
ncbi:sensor histidine kinase [Nocardioides pinisoli]|uniref:Histidine kinase n=1 Tax=Nocardioides pinisoli TaxID=2950279 RepID=A0ABT1L347_9ACTN|nr:histidine kinase [Nocardioides pinisoli]MCP3424447.1 histidine kinase [Nocardioides pinisoli]